jgi:hypothetical protein
MKKTSNKETNIILEAIFQNDFKKTNEILKNGIDPNIRDFNGRTPLFQAIVEGNVEIVQELLKFGAEINIHDNAGNTPLHFAANEYQISIAKILIDKGATVDAVDFHGNTPLSNAVYYSKGRGEMILLLLEKSADKTYKNKHGISPEKLADSIANYNVIKFFQAR